MGAEVARPGRAVQLIRLTGGRGSLVGPPARVALALEELRSTGRLVEASNAAPDGTGQVVVTVRLLPVRPQGAPPARSRWTRRRIAIATTAALAVVGVIGAAAWLVLAWVAAHAALFVILAAVVLLTGGGSCVTVVRITHRH